MAHSLTGASSSERWMNCSGYLSLAQAQGEAAPERLDPDYTREGTAGHLVAAWCLREGKDAWEFTGRELEGVTIGEGDGRVSPTAIQEYINECRRLMEHSGDRRFIEYSVGADEKARPHPGFYGTLDFGCIDPEARTVFIRDLKMGEGVYVEVEHNEQLMYYAFGLLLEVAVPPDWSVELGIVQPRYWDYQGPRLWTTTVRDVLKWGHEVLLPQMRAASAATPVYVPGEWCRFCPVKLKCPVMRGMFGAAAKNAMSAIDPKAYTDDEIGREYAMIPMVEMFLKTLKGEVNFRAQAGRKSEWWKLVKEKVNRVWKKGAFEAMRERLGELAMTVPELKSPAQMEKVSDQAKALVAEWAYTPEGALIASQVKDRRPPEKSRSIADVFAGYEQRS